MSDVLADPFPVAQAALDPELTAKLRGYTYSALPVNQCPQSWQSIITVARAAMRGVVDMATLTQLASDQFGDAIDATQIAFAGPPDGTFLLDVRADRIVATAVDTAAGIPDDCFRWSVETAPDIIGGSARGPVLTLFPPNSRPRVATVHYSLVVGGVTYRQSQTDNFPKGYPVFQRMAPTDAPIGGAPFTLHCYGVDFDPAAKIVWNGGEEPTTFIDSTHLTTGVQPGTAVVTTSVPVSIRNPTADSDSIWFAFVGTGQADLPPTKF